MLSRKTRKVVSGEELAWGLASGSAKVAKAVGSTLGPNGRPVMVEYEAIMPAATKDGFYVAMEAARLEDPVENLAAAVLLQAAQRQAASVGDSTTTTVVLAEALFRAVRNGYPRERLKADALKVASALAARSARADARLLRATADIAGNDSEIGGVVDGVLSGSPLRHVILEESAARETQVRRCDGFVVARGSALAGLTETVEGGESAVAVVNGKISTVADAVAIMQLAAQMGFRSLLAVAQSFDPPALMAFAENISKGKLAVIPVPHGWRGSEAAEGCSDLAAYVGGRAVGGHDGRAVDMRTVTTEDLGRASRVTSRGQITAIESDGYADRVKGILDHVKASVETAKTDGERSRLLRRQGSLTGGYTVISVGGRSGSDVREIKDRYEDAVFAWKAAAETGVLPGAGTSLAWAANSLKEIGVEPDRGLVEALNTPFLIMRPDLDPLKLEWNDGGLLEKGIVDAAKATCEALENAAAAAWVLSSMGSAILYSDAYRASAEVAED